MRRASLSFARQCELVQLPVPVTEYRFSPPRRWRFDFAWPDRLIALECEGGVWTQGRHVRGSGFLRDAEKYNTAALLGWRLLRVTPKQIENGQALTWVERILGGPR